MPSFKSVFFALATLSVTVFAGPVDNNDIFENPLARRASPADLEKRAPSRNNIGKKCRFNASCHTSQPLGKAFCNKERVCDFRCTGGSVKENGKCVGSRNPIKCRFNANCPRTTVKNAVAQCGSQALCTFKCLSGFHPEGNQCIPNEHLCGGKVCPSVSNGYSICRDGKWIPQCSAYLGLVLYENNGKFACINTSASPSNCGGLGRACPPSYNGLGRPVCNFGKCGLDCRGYRTRTLPNGQQYCSRI